MIKVRATCEDGHVLLIPSTGYREDQRDLVARAVDQANSCNLKCQECNKPAKLEMFSE